MLELVYLPNEKQYRYFCVRSLRCAGLLAGDFPDIDGARGAKLVRQIGAGAVFHFKRGSDDCANA